MESDAFFYRLFKRLPQTLFELIGLPGKRADSYRFDSVELKKAFRIDGLFLPKKSRMPLYFVEVQFKRVEKFYANLFSKVFCYLEENDPRQEWVAVAIFPTRHEEPKHLEPYEDLLNSQRVKRIYLEDYVDSENLPVGMGILQLLFATMSQARALAPRIVQNAESGLVDSDLQAKVVQLVEELLVARFPQFDLEEIRMKFNMKAPKLYDLRETKTGKKIHEDGVKEGDTGRLRRIIDTLVAKGKTFEEIADLLDIPAEEIRRAATHCGH